MLTNYFFLKIFTLKMFLISEFYGDRCNFSSALSLYQHFYCKLTGKCGTKLAFKMFTVKITRKILNFTIKDTGIQTDSKFSYNFWHFLLQSENSNKFMYVPYIQLYMYSFHFFNTVFFSNDSQPHFSRKYACSFFPAKWTQID